VSVDRALTNARFRSVPTALERAKKKFMLDVESFTEWREQISAITRNKSCGLLSENL